MENLKLKLNPFTLGPAIYRSNSKTYNVTKIMPEKSEVLATLIKVGETEVKSKEKLYKIVS